MIDIARQHIGDGLNAAMRMPGEAREIFVRPVVAEIIEQQERIELGGIAKAEGTAQVYAAPSIVGFDETMRLTGRMDIGGTSTISLAASGLIKLVASKSF